MIVVERPDEGRILKITLDRPKANILNSAMLTAIETALDEALSPTDEAPPKGSAQGPALHTPKVIVFASTGKHFCFGASVEEHQAQQAAAMLEQFHGLFGKLIDYGVPTCAIVTGQCLGGGLELASFCSFVFASPNARFGQPEVKLSVFPPMASLLLPWRIGGGPAMDLCVSGRSIDAERAFQLGLCTSVDEDPAAAWKQYYDEHLRSTSAVGLRFSEMAVRQGLARKMQTRLPLLEELYLNELMNTHDANEGIAAFMEHRKPLYKDA